MLRTGVKLALAVLLAFAVLEVSFRLAGHLGRWERGTGGLTAGHQVVLCIGDSHTWGLGSGYPARLAERLGGPGSPYRVINMGVPGSNTAQVRERLGGYLDRFQPRLVVLWAGINNKGNRASSDSWERVGVERASFWRHLLDSSRVLRFVRLWRNERELNRFLEGTDTYVRPGDGGGMETLESGGTLIRRHRRDLMGKTEVFDNVRSDKLPPEQMRRVTELDVRLIAEELRARGTPLIVVSYPLESGWFSDANYGIRAAVAATGVDLVESEAVLQGLKEDFLRRGIPFDRRTFLDRSVHPTQLLYAAIGDRILELARERGFLPEAAPRDGRAAAPSLVSLDAAEGAADAPP